MDIATKIIVASIIGFVMSTLIINISIVKDWSIKKAVFFALTIPVIVCFLMGWLL